MSATTVHQANSKNWHGAGLTGTTLTYYCIIYNHGDQIWNHHKCLSWLFPLHLNTYWHYGSTAIINSLILSVRGPSLDVRIWRLRTSPRWKGETKSCIIVVDGGATLNQHWANVSKEVSAWGRAGIYAWNQIWLSFPVRWQFSHF